MCTAVRRSRRLISEAFLTAILSTLLMTWATASVRAEAPPATGPVIGAPVDLDALRARGYEGPIDLGGRTVALDAVTLAPSLEPTAGGTAGWRAGFQLPGFDDAVRAMAIYQGNLYVGGSFNYVGDVCAGRLARWDGASWTGVPLPASDPSGMSVNDLAVVDGSLFVGGGFTFFDHAGIWCQNIARYDGATWSAVGQVYNGTAGFDGSVYAMGINPEGRLVVGGSFSASGLTTLRGVTYLYNGNWYPMASGVNGSVVTITSYGGQLVIGGTFTGDNLGNGLGRIARWTGSAWRGISALAASSNGDVRSLEVHEGNLYAGGRFTSIEGAAIDGLASWNGTTWSSVPGFPGGINVTFLRSTPSLLVASGTYRTGGAVWDSLDDGVMNGLLDAILFGDQWIVGGYYFDAIDAVVSKNLAVLNAGQLDPWPSFSGAGLGGAVTALAVHEGEVVASGEFQTAGSSLANRLAAWDGSQWHEIGGGLSAGARAITSYGANLVVGGSFLTAGDTPATRIAMWDGTLWHALGSGLSSTPEALMQYGDDLVAAGGFTTAGGLAIPNIALWDGSQWSALGGGLNGVARALIVRDGLLIVGGSFTTAGGNPAAHLAAWDGSSWSEYAGGADGDVYALVDLGGDLAAGGYFGQIGGVAASRVARLRGAQWEPIGTGFVGQYCWNDPGGYHCIDLGVERLAACGSHLYASGTVNRVGAVSFNGVARWDDWSHWTAMGNGIVANISAMVGLGDAVYVGGPFSSADGIASTNLAAWDEPALSSTADDHWWGGFDGNGPDGPAYAIGTYGDDLIVAGMFDHVGSIPSGAIGAWDGQQWRSLGGGLEGAGINAPQVHAVLEYQGDLYAAGMFSVPPSTTTCDLARWDGAAWEALGLPGELLRGRALAVFDERLFVGGTFLSMGGQTIKYLAAWDGSSFSALGSGLNGDVTALAVYGGKLIVGGSFTMAGGLPVQNLAVWNGAAWEAPPADLKASGAVFSLLSQGTDLYVGGVFGSVGGPPALLAWKVARWDGSAFHALGTGMDGTTDVRTLAWADGKLVAGGSFTSVHGVPLSYLAAWDGAAWAPLGTGVNGIVWGTGNWKGDLYVGGELTVAGGRNSPYVGRWVLSPTGVVADRPPAVPLRLEAAYPNPFNPSTTIRFDLARAGSVGVTVHDLRGRLIRTIADERFEAGPHSLEWDGRDAAGRAAGSGIYFVRVMAAGTSAVGKVTLLK